MNAFHIQKTLRISYAMQVILTNRLLNFEEFVVDLDAIAPKVGRPKTYGKQ